MSFLSSNPQSGSENTNTPLPVNAVSNPLAEYNKVMRLLEQEDTEGGIDSKTGDVYKDLMLMENNVLNVVNRVAESKLKDDDNVKKLSGQTVGAIIATAANTWKNMFVEMLKIHDVSNLVPIFIQGDRKIYSGILLVLVGLFVLFVDLAS